MLAVAAVASRVPTAAMGLVPTLVVQGAGGSLRTAGLATASFLTMSGLSAPLRGRRLDRSGPIGGLVVPAAVSGVLAVLGAVLLAETLIAGPLGVVLFAIVGMSWPPTGVAVQKAWRALCETPAAHEGVFALDAALQRFALVLGPLLVGLLTAVASARVALVAVAALMAAAVAMVAALPQVRGAGSPEYGEGRRPLLGQLSAPGFGTLLATLLLTDVAIGFVQVGVPGFAAGHGSAALAGPILATVLLAGSAGALVLSRRSSARSVERRYEVVVCASVFGLVPLALVDSLAGLWAAAAIAGVLLAPKLPLTLAVAARLTSPAQHAETMGWLISASCIGVGAGAALAGVVGEQLGPRAALAGAPAAAAVAAAFLLLCRNRLRAAVGHSVSRSPRSALAVEERE